MSGPRSEMVLSPENGSILRISGKGQASTIAVSGEQGLWQARFQDGTELRAADISPASKLVFQSHRDEKTGDVRLEYRSPRIDVVVLATSKPEGIELVADVTPHGSTLLEFALPAKLRFNPNETVRVVCPAEGNNSVGTAFLGSFFKPQRYPTNWRNQGVGSKGYIQLFGGPLAMRDLKDPPVELKLTDEGRRWLGKPFPAGATACVNRPSRAGQFDLVLVDSANGPYFSAKKLGEKGLVWRVGGGVGIAEQTLVPTMVTAAIERLASQATPSRDKIGLLALRCGPVAGSWASVSVDTWRDRLSHTRSVATGKAKYAEITTLDELKDALSHDEFAAILNPYGEGLPVRKAGDLPDGVKAIGEYVRRGGNWFEVGGYTFHAELLPAGHYQQYSANYPSAFSDFLHLETRSGTMAVYRVQPRDWAPWAAEKNPKSMFVPGRLACGSDEKGGWLDRPFGAFTATNTTWRCPKVRLAVGDSARDALRSYAKSNGITRPLADKMRPAVFEKFKRSVLVYYAGNCREKLDNLHLLPVPSLIHFADYLHGGFDKQYPDHLPPKPDFGSPEEFRQFFDQAHKLGHLVMPYTNPTWWCDEPKGPSFEKAGEAPLLKTLDGKLSFEKYSRNTGYTICHWHPAVQEANRRTVRQFREEYPVDVLFQDQCGARAWRYDLNPASPTPLAYSEGLLSMIDEDSRLVPLSTESGWDQVVNAESQLCGMTWNIVPTEHRPNWSRMMRYTYDPETWEVFPVAQYVAHDKVMMIHHDLGQFVTNPQTLSWTLGLGYSLSCRVSAKALGEDKHRQWLLWLDRLQKSVVARYVGQPLDDFKHQRGSGSSINEEGRLIHASYGQLDIFASLDARPQTAAGHELAPFGYWITAPGLVAGNLARLGDVKFGPSGASFVTEKRGTHYDVWLYAAPAEEIAFCLPDQPARTVASARFPGGQEDLKSQPDIPVRATSGGFLLTLPRAAATSPAGKASLPDQKYVWHAVVGE